MTSLTFRYQHIQLQTSTIRIKCLFALDKPKIVQLNKEWSYFKYHYIQFLHLLHFTVTHLFAHENLSYVDYSNFSYSLGVMNGLDKLFVNVTKCEQTCKKTEKNHTTYYFLNNV